MKLKTSKTKLQSIYVICHLDSIMCQSAQLGYSVEKVA